VFGGVAYVVTSIHFGSGSSVTAPTATPRPGDIRATPITGGTTVGIPVQISVPTHLAPVRTSFRLPVRYFAKEA
jgi:hypothetical protein